MSEAVVIVGQKSVLVDGLRVTFRGIPNPAQCTGALFSISARPGNTAHTGPQFRASVLAAAALFPKIIVLVNDAPQAHYSEEPYGVALPKIVAQARLWWKEHGTVFEESGKLHSVLRWQDIEGRPSYAPVLQTFRQAATVSGIPAFRAALDAEVQEFVSRQVDKRGANAQALAPRAEAFLVEELTGYAVLSQEEDLTGYVCLYPYRKIKIFSALERGISGVPRITIPRGWIDIKTPRLSGCSVSSGYGNAAPAALVPL